MSLFFILFLLINSIKSCPLTDNYLSRCHCGILTNGESYIKCDEQSLNEIPIFKRSFPYDELILSNNNIKILTQSSFDNIKTIKRINLENNSISSIDNDLLRLLGNYLEELIITGDYQINSLEFLTRYPLKNLRVLKLDRFNLSEINLGKIFLNMTKLEIVYLRSCQLKQIPNLLNIQILDLEHNQISDSISLSTSYIHLNLAKNFISEIILEKNLQLETLNLSSNAITSIDFSNFNENLMNINLNYNRLVSINLNKLPNKLISLSLSHNLLKQIKFPIKSSLLSLDLSFNQLKTIEKNILFEKLNYLNLQQNPLECNCQLEWLKKLISSQNKINSSTWTCASKKSFLSSDFQCLSITIPRIIAFNISYMKISSENGLFIKWLIIDEHQILDYIQISISEPFYLSPKMSANQTEVFLSNSIQSNKKYHICLILLHKYARDKYCREFLTDKLLLISSNEKNSIQFNEQFDINLYMMLIGTCIGGLITFLLILTCCYLCLQIHKYNVKKKKEKTQHLHYPIYHSSHSTTCPYHHENISNSTDSSQIDTSLSTSNLKHIYQTIDSQDYSSLKLDTQLFHLWNESLRQKR
jgi:hypothetical protein